MDEYENDPGLGLRIKTKSIKETPNRIPNPN